MELTAPDGRRGSKNYPQEFRETVVGHANDPERSIADVAQEHGLNARMVAKWCRREYMQAQAAAVLPSPDSFLPQLTTPSKQQATLAVERGLIRVRIEGVPDLDVLRVVLASLRDGK